MHKMEAWVAERLQRISPEQFITTPHRILKIRKTKELTISYFHVPLSAGYGSAILCTPEASLNSEENLILIFHGFGNDSIYPIQHWIQSLTQAGYSVLSVDWDGHGYGGFSVLDLQEATRSIPILLQRLYGDEERSGLSQKRSGPACFLMGFSMGAALTLIASVKTHVASVIHGVIAVSPAISINPIHIAARELESYFNPYTWTQDFLNKIHCYGFGGFFPACDFFKRKKFPVRLRLKVSHIEQVKDFVFETFVKRRLLRQIKVPVLWLHGVKDHLAPFDKVAPLMMEIPSAFFAFSDPKRGHLRMAFADNVAKLSQHFIEQSNTILKS